MQSGPREIVTPFRPIPLDVPEGMKPNEFFNSTENLNDLAHNNGLLQNPEGLLMYRKAIGHSNEFDTSIIYNTSRSILDPLGRPVRRTQVPDEVRHVWNRMNQIIIDYMLETYPDPQQHLVLAGEAHAVFVRSPHAHARIRTVDKSKALALAGVLAVLDGQDFLADGLQRIPHNPNQSAPPDIVLVNKDGSDVFIPHQYPLPADKARHVGEAVAMVVAAEMARADGPATCLEMAASTEMLTEDRSRTCAGRHGPLGQRRPRRRARPSPDPLDCGRQTRPGASQPRGLRIRAS